MKFIVFKKRLSLFLTIAILIFIAFSSISQEAGKLSPQDTIKHYREILRTEKDSREIAGAHYEIGYALEKMGRETEATAEYLKIIINYPEIQEINKKAEARLAQLYSGFSEKSKELVSGREVTQAQKDPTIFFAYIKSLYENHRNLGQYDKALNVLKKLYDMDLENTEYLIDMGNIYLHGYNDADKAIFHFKKALNINPNELKALVDLGKAYEKKGDYDNAIMVYNKATQISPASPFAIYGLRRTEAIRLASDKRLIKDWYFLGSFDNSDLEGLNKTFPPEEEINIGATYIGKDNIQISWHRHFNYGSSGYVDLNMLFKPNDYSVAYALTYLYSPNEREIQFRFGSEDTAKIWLNDKEILDQQTPRAAEADDDLIIVNLKKGWNKIFIKVADAWGAWGFYFRVTDLRGRPIEDLIFDPIKDDTRRKYVYSKIKRQKRFQITKIASIYAFAVSIFLLGLYFMISNIQNRIKINRMKEDFISSVSHELKTPIAAVRMLAETLKRGKVKGPERTDQYYDMIMRESDRLTRFINKILDFSRLEKGRKIFYFEKENVVDVAKTAVEIYKDEAQDENLNIYFNADKDKIVAEIDKDAILQVILNLMDNAYKYSKDVKEITVNVKDVEKEVRIEVIDKGLGIPKYSLEKIFDKFYRSDREISKAIKGSGLGLSFVKSIINSHNGKIAVESEIDKGSKFIISLPTERT